MFICVCSVCLAYAGTVFVCISMDAGGFVCLHIGVHTICMNTACKGL